MKNYLTISLVLFSVFLSAQTLISQDFYKGTIGDNLKVSFYLKIEENGCPTTYASAMYKYDSNKDDNWLLLNSTMNYEKGNYTLVEIHNTGTLILQKSGNKMIGIWVSPDGKKQLPVQLQKVDTTPKDLKYLEEKLDQEFYEANDC